MMMHNDGNVWLYDDDIIFLGFFYNFNFFGLNRLLISQIYVYILFIHLRFILVIKSGKLGKLD